MSNRAQPIDNFMTPDLIREAYEKYAPAEVGLPEDFADPVNAFLMKPPFPDMDNATRKAVYLYLTRMLSKVERKGILCVGPTGTYKTAFLKQLSVASGAWIVSANEIRRMYSQFKSTYDLRVKGDRYLERAPRELMIDDIGTESILNDFGNVADVVAEAIDTRYNLWLHEGHLAHFTTNLTMDEIEQRYDSRTRSRLSEMCVMVVFAGHDRRIG